MPDLLGRPLTAPEQTMAAEIHNIFRARGRGREAAAELRRLASSRPHLFLGAALSVLDAEPDPGLRLARYHAIAECPEFWSQLLYPGRFNRPQLLEICRHLMAVDNMLDVRLAHLTPGRYGAGQRVETETVLRILDVLDELSPGCRLILLLNHLTTHDDQRIAAKATLLIGRRLRNPDWVASHLGSSDGRVRASAVESLWGSRAPSARASLWTSLKDKNNRVVGNALVGLHELGEPDVNEFVKRMITDPRPPFRWTAAWVMGKIGSHEFVECLERAQQDKEAQVRRAAHRALEAIRSRAAAEPEPGTGAAAGVPDQAAGSAADAPDSQAGITAAPPPAPQPAES